MLQINLTPGDLPDVLADSFDPVRPRDFILEDIANVDSQIPDACYSLIIRNIAGLQAENEKVLMFTFCLLLFCTFSLHTSAMPATTSLFLSMQFVVVMSWFS